MAVSYFEFVTPPSKDALLASLREELGERGFGEIEDITWDSHRHRRSALYTVSFGSMNSRVLLHVRKVCEAAGGTPIVGFNRKPRPLPKDVVAKRFADEKWYDPIVRLFGRS